MSTRPAIPFRDEIAYQATHWLMRLWSGEMTEKEHQSWQDWRQADPENERAWQHIEQINARFRCVPTPAALQVARSVPSRAASRRRMLKCTLLGLTGSGAFILGMDRYRPLPYWTADYQLDAQAPSAIQLEDGTLATLDAQSAMNLRFDTRQRVIELLGGSVHISTAKHDQRPFFVDTALGRIEALGTKFIVSLNDLEQAHVQVLEHAVRLYPADAPEATQTLEIGQAATLTRHAVRPIQPWHPNAMAWVNGHLVANDMRLEAFAAALRRYRPGYLGVDPALRDLRLSGVYTLQDTDRILDALADILPLRVARRSRYWVRLEPA